jgi:hypothetical protein
MMNRLWYVIYEDGDGNEASTLVYAPTEALVHALMRPRPVHTALLVEDSDFELEVIAEADNFTWKEEP